MATKNTAKYTCRIENIPARYSIEDLEQHFIELAKTITGFDSISILYEHSERKYKFDVIFINENGAKDAVRLFDGAQFDGVTLQATYLYLKSISLPPIITASPSVPPLTPPALDSLTLHNNSIKAHKLVIKKGLQHEPDIFIKLEAKYMDVKIMNRIEEGLISLSGKSDFLNMVSLDLNNWLLSVSSKFETKFLELDSDQHEHLYNQTNEIQRVENKTSTIISVENIEIHANFKIPGENCEIVLLQSNYLNINADAYVLPAYQNLENSDGLVKGFVEAAGNSLQLKCNEHIKRNGALKNGNVFVTTTDVGVRKDATIIFAVSPTWKNGTDYDEQILSSLITTCLLEADKNNCSSILIPPLSTGIGKFPIALATRTISQACSNYISTNSMRTRIKRILFCSNTIETVKVWQGILLGMSSSGNNKVESKEWFWKDNHNKWKPYGARENDLISQNYEKYLKSGLRYSTKESRFELKIDGKEYTIDLINKRQINKETNNERHISNDLSLVTQCQWSWEYANSKTKPYEVQISKQIEQAYRNGDSSVAIQLGGNDNDDAKEYIIVFNRNSSDLKKYKNSIGYQLNKETGRKRSVYRNETGLSNMNDANIRQKYKKCVLITGFINDIRDAQNMILDSIKFGHIEEKLRAPPGLSSDDIKRIENENNVIIIFKNDMLIIKGFKNKIERIKTEIIDLWASHGSHMVYPKEWSEMDEDQNLELVNVNSISQEYKWIYNEISKTIQNSNILSIQRIQNKWLWKLYQKELQTLKGKNVNERWLYHGTSSTDPEKIYNGEYGFDIRFSQKGMWGIGIYFAVNASYSKNGYAHNNNDGSKCIFYCRVLLGDVIQLQSDNSLRIPPLKDSNNLNSSSNKLFTNERYNTVGGFTNGSQVYIIYENSRAYPQYLINFKENSET